MADQPDHAVSALGILRTCLNAAVLLVCTGCQTLTANPGQPALIVQPDADSIAALQATLSNIFGGQEVRLANDAFTRSSILVLQPDLKKTFSTPPATGRVLSAPFKFRLIKNGDACSLVDLRDGKRYRLADTACVAE